MGDPRISHIDPNAFGDGRLKTFAEGLWTATTPIRFAMTWFPHVMTVVRLANGDLLLHSPCGASNDLLHDIDNLGRVAHVVAPNWFHDLYLREYRNLYPKATFWAPAFLQRQQRSIVDAALDSGARPPWYDEMPHASLRGLLTFDECLFFHTATRTLIVADLLMNAAPSPSMPALTRLGYRFFGLDGSVKVFPILQWFGIRERGSVHEAASRVFKWNPDRLIVGHGTPIQEHVATELHRAFRWLLG